MKKIIILPAVLICAFAVFADSISSGSVKISPYSLQIVTNNSGTEDSVLSNYGFGEEVSYKRYINDGMYAEGGIGFNAFFMPDERPNLANLTAFCGIGYKIKPAADEIFVNGHLDVAGDFSFYNEKHSLNIAIKTGAELGFDLIEQIELSFGCEGTISFAKDESSVYVTYKVAPTVCATYNF